MAASAEQKAERAASAGGGPSKLPLILVLVNSVIILAAVGLLTYTKLIFKRAPITEDSERARLAALKAAPKVAVKPGTVVFDAVTVNIASTPAQPKAADGTAQQLAGKLHYANLGFVLEIRDIERKVEIERLRPVIMDKLLSILGRKAFHELTTVQGRYVLRTQLIDLVNQLVNASLKTDAAPVSEPPLVTGVFFTQFVVQ